MFELANDVSYITWGTLQSTPLNRLGLSFSVQSRLGCNSVHYEPSRNVQMLAVPWVPEFYIKTWNPSRMIAYVENSARPETWARDTGLAEYTVLRNSNAVFAQLVPRLASFCHQRFKQEGSVISKTCRVAGTALLAVEAVTASVHAN